ASESLVVAYRGRVLAALAVAAVLLALTVWIAMRMSVVAHRRATQADVSAPSPRAGITRDTAHRTARVLLPLALTTLLILAVLRLCGVHLTLAALVALIRAAGLGLDYALFFDPAGDDYADQLRTLHALIVCSLMTLLVFSLLALSSIPVLRAIGSTVALGVLGNFVLALLISRQPTAAGPKQKLAAEAAPTRAGGPAACSGAPAASPLSRTTARCAGGPPHTLRPRGA